MSSRAAGHAAGLNARGSTSREGARRLIVAAEVAISLVLVCGAVLMFKSLLRLQRVDTGVRIDNVMTMLGRPLDRDLSQLRSRGPLHRGGRQFQLRAVPGVERAAVSTDLPMREVRQADSMSVAGTDGGILVRFKRVDAEYFTTLDVPVLAGRAITRSDRAGAPRVVVVNESLARTLAERFQWRT